MIAERFAKAISDGVAFLSQDARFENYALVGSALYAADPKDVDFVVKTKTEFWEAESTLLAEGWARCGDDYDTQNGLWGAVRKGDLNLMLTHSQEFFDKYVLAMELSKALRLQTKEERIIACRVIRDGCNAQDARRAAYPGGVLDA